MKFDVTVTYYNDGDYFITLDRYRKGENILAKDASIAKWLDISLKEYRKVLIKYKAKPCKDNNE